MSYRADQPRLFFALFPDARVRRAIVGAQSQLNIEGRPVRPENLHVTLAFLGNVPAGRLEELKELAGRIPLSPLTLCLERWGCFPRAGVAFLAPDESPSALDEFQNRLTDALAAARFRIDRKPWVPHLTLYRKMRTPCERIRIEPICWPIREFCLVASRLEKTGPVYRVVERWPATEKGRFPN